jgi:divalent metal cation (Fe/Co/Zn/Cd) transporter
MGRSLIVEIEGTLENNVSLLEADTIGHEVKHAVLARISHVKQVYWLPHCQSAGVAGHL